ncbi:MAG TPA: flagellar hook-associated protein FlgL [Azoarcus taiwanensis]|uniref:Flagellar hook-associated protein 3 n=1 Tax=Azoarcus taiwanensis TaxID=666964 RepID=A0A972F779_9RHOO|nr:flagellar hook-associated protein FlgL [Azoarcus taiwanensis]NMG02923.1 flagellar hook-associated protein 3 [Azoarcus taiwanensis]HRQ58834.1 flagellar hook-associated protein FlgL [Azoarcus taiwanensis]
MRISSSMIYQRGLNALQQQTFDLVRTQQQVATGRRILTPADDPIASARALELNQTKAVNSQFANNLAYANDNLRLLENKLVGVGDILQYARERSVQAGNGAATAEDLRYIATDLKSQFEALVALANSQDGQGDYLFAGYRADTQPFAGGLAGVNYAGDQGERTIQVSASRYMPTSFAGDRVFDRSRMIDVTATRPPTADNPTTNEALYSFRGATNSGTGGGLTVSFGSIAINDPDDPDSPRNPDNQGRRYIFTYAETTPGNPATGSFSVEEVVPGVGRNPVATGLAPGSTYAFNGIEVSLPSHVPAANPNDPANIESGDAFEVMVASTNMFKNVAVAISALDDSSGVGPAGGVAFALENLDAALENILGLRAQVGSQMVEAEQLQNLGSDLDLQYATAISRLEDVDYAEAISRLTRQQAFLQAAQQSYVRITGLSLFNFIN